MRLRRAALRSAGLLTGCLLAGAALLPAATFEPRLAGDHELWLLAAEHLLSTEERELFARLASPAERDLFIRRFWRSRSFQPEPAREEAAPLAEPSFVRPLTRWRESFEEARRLFPDLSGDRARAYLLAGRPAERIDPEGCEDVIRPLEVWEYTPWHLEHRTGQPAEEGLFLVFFQHGNPDRGRFRQWDPSDGAAALMYAFAPAAEWTVERLIEFAGEQGCLRWHPGKSELFAAALRGASSFGELAERLRPRAADTAWLAGLAASLRAGEGLPVGEVEIEPLGRYSQKTVLRGRIRVPISEVRRSRGSLLFDRLVIRGDVWRGARLVDSFEVVHHVAGAPAGPAIPLDFFRRLRPGAYRLDLALTDGLGLPLLRLGRPLEVPALEHEAAPPAGFGKDIPALTRSEVGILTTLPSVALLSPGASPLAGAVEIEAATTGGPIARVDFHLDGRLAASDREPPYAARLDLGPEPGHHELEAIAYDPAGRRLAADRRLLNEGSERFSLRLVEPVRGRPSERVAAELEIPDGARLESLELYLDERLLARLSAPPFACPLPASWRRSTYVRAVARLADGRMTEALEVLPTTPLEEVDVRLVELYTSVADGRGRAILDLEAESFRIFEDGAEQRLLRFETLRRLPVRVALLMDVSSSMRGRVRVAAESARRFFDTVLTEEDRASLLTFHHDIRVRVPFTAERRLLLHGASGLRAHGTTRLNDALVYAAASFAGLGGKRALVLLSDGEDVDSDFDFERVLEVFLRARLAVYPILLDLAAEETREELRQLAAVSGGRLFEIRGVGELAGVYRAIEEDLRSQYLLVYEPPPTAAGAVFRKVRVEVDREGAHARTLSGYYP